MSLQDLTNKPFRTYLFRVSCKDGEWKTVERRNTKTKPTIIQKKWIRKDQFTHGKGYTLFIDFLPMQIKNHQLKQTFRGYGEVTNAFVPWKLRGGLTYRFAFVRFAKREEVINAIRGENGSLWGEFRIKVQWVRFDRNSKIANGEEYARKEYEEGPNPQAATATKGKPHSKTREDGRSYREVLQPRNDIEAINISANLGEETDETRKEARLEVIGDSKLVKLKLPEAEENRSWLQRSIVGVTASLATFSMIEAQILAEGIKGVDIRPLGGQKHLITFSEEEDFKLAVEPDSWLSDWKPLNGDKLGYLAMVYH